MHYFSAGEVRSIFTDIVQGLGFLVPCIILIRAILSVTLSTQHDRSILHLDLKPGNVLLSFDDGLLMCASMAPFSSLKLTPMASVPVLCSPTSELLKMHCGAATSEPEIPGLLSTRHQRPYLPALQQTCVRLVGRVDPRRLHYRLSTARQTCGVWV